MSLTRPTTVSTTRSAAPARTQPEGLFAGWLSAGDGRWETLSTVRLAFGQGKFSRPGGSWARIFSPSARCHNGPCRVGRLFTPMGRGPERENPVPKLSPPSGPPGPLLPPYVPSPLLVPVPPPTADTVGANLVMKRFCTPALVAW